MKQFFILTALVPALICSCGVDQKVKTEAVQEVISADTVSQAVPKNLYLDVHHLGPGKAGFDGVAEAHAKDLAVQAKYGVNFIRYWVDESRGNVYCLASAQAAQSVREAHAAAHGLLPDRIDLVTEGPEAPILGGNDFFLDIHELGAGKVTAQDVAGAHLKDLAVQEKYGVNFINYWVNEKEGTVTCLSQAPDSSAVVKTHTAAHGLVPVSVTKVKQGQ